MTAQRERLAWALHVTRLGHEPKGDCPTCEGGLYYGGPGTEKPMSADYWQADALLARGVRVLDAPDSPRFATFELNPGDYFRLKWASGKVGAWHLVLPTTPSRPRQGCGCGVWTQYLPHRGSVTLEVAQQLGQGRPCRYIRRRGER